MSAASGRAGRIFAGAVLGAAAGVLSKELQLPALVSYWGDPAPLVAVLAAAGALFGWRGSLRPVWVTLAALQLAWAAVAYTPLTPWLARGLVRSDPVADAEAIVVLSSSVQSDGELSTTALSRLLRGLELAAGRRAPRLVLAELHPPHRSYAEPARALAAGLGVALELRVVGPVSNTRDEAEAARALAEREGWRRALVVTSPTHTRRACAAMEAVGLEVICVPSVETRYDLPELRLGRDRVEAFGSLAHEWLGLWVYGRRGWLRSAGTSPARDG